MKGFLLSNNDFMLLNKDGINFLSLGNNKKERVVRDKDGMRRNVHRLGACNFLKLEKTNHIEFSF